MKNLYASFILVAFMLLQSCSSKPVIYDSEAKLPFHHTKTKTVFELAVANKNGAHLEFGVVAAKDDDTLSYVLLAPLYSGSSADKLKNVNLNNSVPLLPNQVREFISILQQSAAKWDENISKKNGIEYRFLVSPEYRIVPVSENVLKWYPTFKYYFQNNSEGPLGNIIFGEDNLQYYFQLDQLSEINTLIDLLNIALNSKNI